MAGTSESDSAMAAGYLERIVGDPVGELITLTSDRLLIGRYQRTAQIYFEDVHVSRRHCIMRIKDNCWYLRDIRSKNGTFLNGIKLEPTNKYRLRNGYKIYLGKPEYDLVAYIFLTKKPNEQCCKNNISNYHQNSIPREISQDNSSELKRRSKEEISDIAYKSNPKRARFSINISSPERRSYNHPSVSMQIISRDNLSDNANAPKDIRISYCFLIPDDKASTSKLKSSTNKNEEQELKIKPTTSKMSALDSKNSNESWENNVSHCHQSSTNQEIDQSNEGNSSASKKDDQRSKEEVPDVDEIQSYPKEMESSAIVPHAPFECPVEIMDCDNLSDCSVDSNNSVKMRIKREITFDRLRQRLRLDFDDASSSTRLQVSENKKQDMETQLSTSRLVPLSSENSIEPNEQCWENTITRMPSPTFYDTDQSNQGNLSGSEEEDQNSQEDQRSGEVSDITETVSCPREVESSVTVPRDTLEFPVEVTDSSNLSDCTVDSEYSFRTGIDSELLDSIDNQVIRHQNILALRDGYSLSQYEEQELETRSYTSRLASLSSENSIQECDLKRNDQTTEKFQKILEDSLLCSICNEAFVKATTLNCCHTFCQYCISEWKKVESVCPICRKEIASEVHVHVLDDVIEKLIKETDHNFMDARKKVLFKRKKSGDYDEDNDFNDG
ncbi:e3 ubiquitin-protein ligase rnf8 [Caerostris darwini]|uniref:E3 ubiquitin-protein ligase CHFR n=1 Tax=Caerostris darwini TaxID=1538125 RepID=A0AAV4Q5F8_9ARAC|nr:e3 ubiquitin-protein ligase rnf8 [Caerostris darwini]